MSMKEVKTKNGTIVGISEDTYSIFKGVPYAKPPMGTLRWKAPQPLEPWADIYYANIFPNASLQAFTDPEGMYTKEFYSNPAFSASSSEDCLYLNIWTPANSSSDNLPVLLWIHGGGFEHGFSYEEEFDGAAYCEHGIIFVSINYRVGALGFLCHEFLQDSEGHMGNYGILDQIAALKWVKENIIYFGGNPNTITIMGQSAGAISTQVLCSSPLSKNLFRSVILQSGGGYQIGLGLDSSLSYAQKIANIFVKLCDITSPEDFYSLSTDKILSTSAKIMEIAQEKQMSLPFSPIVDSYVLTDTLDACVENNLIADIPYLLGSTKDDLGTSSLSESASQKGTLFDAAITFASKRNMASDKPTYIYYFKHNLPGSNDGAFHSCELWYTFGTLKRCWRPFTNYDFILSEQMLSYWCHFIATGNPNSSYTTTWEPFTKVNPYYKTFE